MGQLRRSRCQAEISPGTAEDKEVGRDNGASRRAAAGLNIAQGSLSLPAGSSERLLPGHGVCWAPTERPRHGGRQPAPRPAGESEARAAGKRESARCGIPGRGDRDGCAGVATIREDEEIPGRQEGFPMAGAAAWPRGDRGCRRCSREGRVREHCREGSDRRRAVCHGNAFTRGCLKHGVTVRLFLPGGSTGIARPSGSPGMVSVCWELTPSSGRSRRCSCCHSRVWPWHHNPTALHIPLASPTFLPSSSLHITAAKHLRVWG